MARYEYEVIINQEPKGGPVATLSYGPTKDIRLRIGKNKAAIYVTMSVAKTAQQLLSPQERLFAHVLKKVMALHLIRYSRNLTFSRVTIRINGEVTDFSYRGKPPLIFSLTSGTFHRKFPPSWHQPAVVRGMLAQTRTQQGPVMSSLYALATAKSKHYQAERFFHLWLAINGCYGFLSEKADQLGVSTRSGKRDEPDREQIKRLLRVYGLGNENCSKAQRDLLAPQILSVLRHYDQPITPATFSEPATPDNLVGKIEALLVNPEQPNQRLDISVKGFLMMELGYYFRCQLFHANKPLPLFSYAQEKELTFLQLISDLLEDFLERELFLLFDDLQVEERINPAILKAAETK